MVEPISGISMEDSSAEIMEAYSIAVTKKMMDSYQQTAQAAVDMLAELPAPATVSVPTKGQYIDVYA